MNGKRKSASTIYLRSLAHRTADFDSALQKLRTGILSLPNNWPVIRYSCLSGDFNDQIKQNGFGSHVDLAPEPLSEIFSRRYRTFRDDGHRKDYPTL